MKMQKRALGNNGLQVSALGLGCMGLNFAYGQSLSKQKSIALFRSAVEQGVNFLDTSEAYDPFTNEEIVGCSVGAFSQCSGDRYQIRFQV